MLLVCDVGGSGEPFFQKTICGIKFEKHLKKHVIGRCDKQVKKQTQNFVSAFGPECWVDQICEAPVCVSNFTSRKVQNLCQFYT